MRGTGPGTYARIAEIMPGRAIFSPRRRLYEPEASRGSQQPAKTYRSRETEAGRRNLVWRMCSGRQGHSPVGESPTVSVARFRHVAIPQFLGVTQGPLRGVNGPAALKT